MAPPTRSHSAGQRALEVGFVAAAALLFASLVLTRLAHPLLWNDEADTAVLAQRVAEHGYPKAHGVPDLLYNLDPSRIDPASDAYLGGLWGAYYFGAPGAAWAARHDDPYAKTWRMRLPFALIGCAGMLWAVLSVLPALGSTRSRALLLGLFCLTAAYSVTLGLHLREARWYSPVLFLVAGCVATHLRWQVFGSGSLAGYVVCQSVLLCLLFNTFHPAFAAVGLALGLDLLWRARRLASPRARLAWLARAGSPLAIAGLACLPVAFVFDLPGLTLAWTDFLAGVARSYGENLLFVARGSLRYEFLAAAGVARVAVLWQLRGLRAAGEVPPVALRHRNEIAGFALLLVAIYWGVVCRSPLVWERYLIPLAPWIPLALLLDGASLVELARRAPRSGARARGLVPLTLVVGCLVVSAWVRWPEFAERLQELRTPVRGPLDFAIPHLRERYRDPSSLVIATNYEGPAFSFYLGSRVLVGYYAGNLAADVREIPDVIVKRPWPRFEGLLLEMTQRAPYAATRFPVRNTKTNSGPFLWTDTPGDARHLFATPFADRADQEFVILERVVPLPEHRQRD